MLCQVLRVKGSFEASRISPGQQVGLGIHHATAELAKTRAAPDHALLFQRAWRQAQKSGCFVVVQILGSVGWCRLTALVVLALEAAWTARSSRSPTMLRMAFW